MRYVAICDGEMQLLQSNIKCNGEWLAVDASGIPNAFDISALNVESLAGHFGAGFICAGVPVLMVGAVSAILKFIKH